MKITKVSIKHYRTCELVEFAPHPTLSVLIGPNGSGKTNVFSALKLLQQLTHHFIRPRLASAALADIPSTPCEIKTWYEDDEYKVIHTATLHLVTNEKNEDEIIRAREVWYVRTPSKGKKTIRIPSAFLLDLFLETENSNRFGTTMPMNIMTYRHYIKRFDLSQQQLAGIGRALNLMCNISYYSASQFTNPGNCPISFEVEKNARRRTGISISGHKELLYDMYQEHQINSDAYEQFKSIVESDGIGLIEDIDFREVVTSTSSYSVRTGGKVIKQEKQNLIVVPSFKISGNNLSPSQLSEGTFKTLALIFYLVTDKNSILIIEEPEVCVHHGLLNSIVELIQTYSEDKQIFVSTHSDTVLDKLKLENVYKVKRGDKEGTTVSSIKKNMKLRELKALKEYLQNEGTLGEFWKYGDLENV